MAISRWPISMGRRPKRLLVATKGLPPIRSQAISKLQLLSLSAVGGS